MNLAVRLLREDDLEAADRIFRLAFGTFNRHPEPEKFGGDIDKIRSRWRADPQAAFGAELDGRLVGSNFVTRWGSVAYFGPLTVHPDFWDLGIAQALLRPTLELLARWGTRHHGLYTYADSPKHQALYQKYGFWPRYLTAITCKDLSGDYRPEEALHFSEAGAAERNAYLAACAKLTDAIYPGLDVSREIRAVQEQNLGETLLIRRGTRLAGFAVCHCGPGSEAGSGACFVKFGAAHPGPEADQDFERLLNACQTFASGRHLSHLHAGVNTSRREAYRLLLAQGFRTQVLGVAMHRPDESAYHHPGLYVLDDWR